MKRIYIAHPLRSGGHEVGSMAEINKIDYNIACINCIMRNLAAEEPDMLLFSPIHAFGYISPLEPQDWVMKQCLEMVEVCDELWVFGDWESSVGCRMEIEHAHAMDKPIFFKEPLSK